MQRSFLLFSVITLFLFITGCQEEYKPQEGEFKMSVLISNGETFQHIKGTKNQYFLPYPVNEGTIQIDGKQFQTALVGKQIEPGKDLYVIPIARMTYLHTDKEEKIILAIPAEKKYRTMEITGYDELITEYYSSKKALEYWYSNRYGLGTVTDMHWSAY